MSAASATSLLRRLRQTVRQHDHADATDGQLLEQFLHHADEAAFAALVRRHGPMVLGVCRRLLRNVHDADDAFQATFLVLFRKAGTLLSRATVGNWLYGVAYHTALKARAAIQKRRDKERQAGKVAVPAAPQEEPGAEQVVDQVVQRLPDKYREPLVLCALEGKSRREAAQQLGIREGTLSSRLATARLLLARRLTAHGCTLAAILGPQAASAQVPNPLLVSTLKAVTLVAAGKAASGAISAQAAAWTEGVLQAMLMMKLKTSVATLLVVALLAVLATMLGQQGAVTAGQPEPVRQPLDNTAAAPPAPAPPKKKFSQFEISAEGERVVVRFVVDGVSYEAVAARVRYDEKTGVLTLEGAGGIAVRLRRQSGKDWEEMQAQRIFFSVNDNGLQVIGEAARP